MKRLCLTPGCLTLTPRPYCYFCVRTDLLTKAGKLKACLRCERQLPITDFAGNGRYHVCDRCRDTAPMTDAEKRKAHRLSPYYQLRRRRQVYRARKAA